MECGCFQCLNVFPAAEVADWIDDGNTPLCPCCGSDALVEDVTDLMELWRLHQTRFPGAARKRPGGPRGGI